MDTGIDPRVSRALQDAAGERRTWEPLICKLDDGTIRVYQPSAYWPNSKPERAFRLTALNVLGLTFNPAVKAWEGPLSRLDEVLRVYPHSAVREGPLPTFKPMEF